MQSLSCAAAALKHALRLFIAKVLYSFECLVHATKMRNMKRWHQVVLEDISGSQGPRPRMGSKAAQRQSTWPHGRGSAAGFPCLCGQEMQRRRCWAVSVDTEQCSSMLMRAGRGGGTGKGWRRGLEDAPRSCSAFGASHRPQRLVSG